MFRRSRLEAEDHEDLHPRGRRLPSLPDRQPEHLRGLYVGLARAGAAARTVMISVVGRVISRLRNWKWLARPNWVHKQTFCDAAVMSALTPKADNCSAQAASQKKGPLLVSSSGPKARQSSRPGGLLARQPCGLIHTCPVNPALTVMASKDRSPHNRAINCPPGDNDLPNVPMRPALTVK